MQGEVEPLETKNNEWLKQRDSRKTREKRRMSVTVHFNTVASQQSSR